ncbi:MAG: shikimate kinase [Ruminococcaceae bacterium]|nr:shikimate kinase [Oscillospiraceae bacterium]
MSVPDTIYGLLGEHLGHSFSPFLHHALGDEAYRLYELPVQELEAFVKQENIGGLNVTIPYKETVLPFADELSPAVEAIGAANTLYRRDGRLIAENTDVLGFLYLLDANRIDVDGKKVLVFGSGGACKAVLEALRRKGAGEVLVVSRRGGDAPLISYDELPDHTDADVVVNTTPVGMYPDNLASVTDLSRFDHLSGVVDIVYNPLRTGLLLQAEALGIPHANGLGMLVAQAVRAHEFFFDTNVDDRVIEDLTARLTRNATNLVLIGMPGSGKSSVAKLLSEKTGREAIELDRAIEEAAGKPIPAIFAEDGEDVFRDLESSCIATAGARNGVILSLGGGAVTRERNYLPLHQNGRIYCLKRDLSLLAMDGRPLSKDLDTLRTMEQERAPMYERFADVTVVNDGTLEDAAETILKDFNSHT